MVPSDSVADLSRRNFLRASAGATAATVAGASASGVAAGDLDAYNGFVEDAQNWDGITYDATGREGHTAQVLVGADDGAQNHAFWPVALVIDPGTTIQWKWTGEGGVHNVVHQNDNDDHDERVFDSGEEGGPGTTDEEGATYEYTFEEGEEGFYTYNCTPHSEPMRGVIVVGEDHVETDVEPFLTRDQPELGGYHDDTPNYRGVENWRGNDEVVVDVGGTQEHTPRFSEVEFDDGLVFESPAINVDDGATVRWVWTGSGGDHNVVEQDGAFESETTGEEGFEFEHEFEEDPEDEEANVYNYVCTPHEGVGMFGSVVVGDNFPTETTEFNWTAVWGGAAVFGVVSVVGVAAYRELLGGDDQPGVEDVAADGGQSPE